MELELDEAMTCQVAGSYTLELPDYIRSLSPVELDLVMNADNRHELLVAAGRHPISGNIIVVTGDGHVLELYVDGHDLPNGQVSVVDQGRRVCVGQSELLSEWVLAHAQVLVSVGPA